MIGAAATALRQWRGWLQGLLGVVLLGGLLAARPGGAAAADPAREAGRERTALRAAAKADAALAELESGLLEARGSARAGAALIVAGDEPPQPRLRRAADELSDSGPSAEKARAVTTELGGVLAAIGWEPSAPLAVPSQSDLLSIAAQLRDSADASGPFLERRHAAERTLDHLAAALQAIEDDDLGGAAAELEAAAEAREVLVRWERPPVTLGPWLETTGRLIGAAHEMVTAARAGDEPAVQAAAREYAAAAAEARRADVSLALSLSETGGGLTATPLRRLADALAAVSEARSAMASLQQRHGGDIARNP